MARALRAGAVAAPRRSLLGRDWQLGFLLTAPVVAVLVGLIAYPFVSAVLFSLQDIKVGGQGRFIGLENYRTLLFGAERERFFNSVWVSIIYTGGALLGKFVLGLTCALILNSAIKARNFWRGLLFLPWTIPGVVSAYAWKWIYDDMRGVLNVQLANLGLIQQPILWLSDINIAMWALLAAVIWQGTPFWIMTFLAGLQSIPQELYEAAQIDGASTAQSFLYITLPSLRNVIIVTFMLSSIWTANSVQYVYILTQGGPANATETFPMLALIWGIRSYNIGMGATVPLLFFPIFAIFIYFLSKRLLQEGEA